jgi:uncharacterized C2H2 Zn-finger protein
MTKNFHKCDQCGEHDGIGFPNWAVCTYCKKTFKSKDELLEHVKNTHLFNKNAD